ncbi:phosphonate metabolism transcriptional regulator PhnF [Burkholderia cepacia]|uniref:phosphonate metabolism transcriptional regulator PhnF n=1 Tax=Burkholderia cepacia TaxID=292 RepID=UPI002AB64172|nr:phosphonate metabolism transcriptional regulator PhnF [Burkholderia cepacia]
MEDAIDRSLKPSLKERRGATSLWRLIERALEDDIRTGVLGPGTQLPGELDLSVRFSVNRKTVRHALAVLRERDLIRIERGRGAFVKERVVRYQLSPTSRLSTSLRDIHRVGVKRFLGYDHVRVDAELSRDLGLERNRYVRKVDTLTVVDGLAVAIASSYFPLPRFDGIEKHIMETGSFTEAWRRYGISHYTRRETRISAVALSKEDADVLSMTPRQPMILVTYVNVDRTGTPIILTTTRAAPQHIEFIVKFNGEQPS